jgi:Caspase domain
MNHEDSDCVVIIVLSHGEDKILYAKDTSYKPEILWSAFTADKCPTLAGKPKLFFIQASTNKMSCNLINILFVNRLAKEIDLIEG